MMAVEQVRKRRLRQDQSRFGVPLRNRSGPREEAQFRLLRLALVFRKARTESGLSLEEVARRSSVSAGLISQVERGLVNPSFVTLVHLRDALDVPWEALFDSRRDGERLVTVRARQKLRLQGGRTLELLTPSFDGPYRLFRTVYPIGHDSTAAPVRWDGQVSIHIFRGRLVVQLGDDEYKLHEGETLTIPPSMSQTTRNPGRTACDAIIVSSQPVERSRAPRRRRIARA